MLWDQDGLFAYILQICNWRYLPNLNVLKCGKYVQNINIVYTECALKMSKNIFLRETCRTKERPYAKELLIGEVKGNGDVSTVGFWWYSRVVLISGVWLFPHWYGLMGIRSF